MSTAGSVMEGVRCLRVGLASTEFQSVLPSHGALEHGLLDGFRRKQYVASPVRPARRHKHGEPTASRDPFDSKHMDESGHVGSTDDVAAMPLDELRRLVPAFGRLAGGSGHELAGAAPRWARRPVAYRPSAALAGIIGGRREWTALTISLGSIPCK